MHPDFQSGNLCPDESGHGFNRAEKGEQSLRFATTGNEK